MEFSNEHWRLIITPQYVRKDNQKIKVDCHSCNGQGFEDETDPNYLGFLDRGKPCFFCHGTGKREVLPEIPPPPEMDQQFLDDLKKWFQNYRR